MDARVIVMKCKNTKKLFGVRVQKFDNDWLRTWAFRLNENVVKKEGYDEKNVSGSLIETEEFPGCPYCGGHSAMQCGKCKRFSCLKGNEDTAECPWCGNSSELEKTNEFTVGTDAF